MTVMAKPTKKAAGTRTRGPGHKHTPPEPADYIDMMICALYGHRLALDGRPEYKILPLAAATAIMSLLYKVRDGQRKAPRRSCKSLAKARIARDLMVTLKMKRVDAVRTAYHDEPNTDDRTLLKRFDRALADLRDDDDPAIEGRVVFDDGKQFDAMIAAAKRTDEGRAALQRALTGAAKARREKPAKDVGD